MYQQFQEIARRLEQHYRDMQDLEFTVEKGRLYMLQTRSAKRNAQAAIKVAVDMVEEGLISEQEAIKRVEPGQVYQLLLPRFDETEKEKAAKEGRLLAKGLNASPGAATGKAVFDADRAEQLGKAGTPVVLVRPETSPDDVHGMLVAKGVLTARGGAIRARWRAAEMALQQRAAGLLDGLRLPEVLDDQLGLLAHVGLLPGQRSASRSLSWSHSAASTKGGSTPRRRSTVSRPSRSGQCGCCSAGKVTCPG